MTPREIADLFADLELQLIASLARNLAKHKAWEKDEGFSWPAWQAQKLNALNRYRRENKRQMQEFKSAVTPEIETLLQEQFKEADGSSETFLGINADKVNALIEEINHTQVNVQKASLRFLDDVYRKTILKADAAFAAGGVTMQQATDRAVRDFLSAGINSIEYRNGRRVNIATYAEMALRTSSARAMLFGEAQKRVRLDIDTVLVSQYGACSNTCLPWQGIVYIDDVWGEYTGESNGSYGISRNGHQYPLLSVAVRGGLFHPNCRHTLTTWIEGISTRPIPMDKAKIERVNRLERRQRTLETQVRKWKRLREGTGTPEEKAAYDRKVQAAQKKLRELIAQHGDVLRRDVWRERDDKVGRDGLNLVHKSDIISARGGLVDIQTGIFSGALDPDSVEANLHSIQYYESVRRMKDDISVIAKNVGWKEDSILKIKNHVFIEKHELGGLEPECFDPDYNMAVSWQRLIEGKHILEQDLVLLKHEYLELTLMRYQGLSYQQAHTVSNQQHNYTQAIEKEMMK
ncbi:MAG: phage minor capsid protein [Ruthenibacterium sp.]